MHVEFTSLIKRWTVPQAGGTAAQGSGSFGSITHRRAAQTYARALEHSGFDRLLISDPEGLPDNSQFGSFLLSNTISLAIAIPHRAGLVDPVIAARQFAKLDQLGDGRLSIRLVPGNEVEQSGGERPFDHEAEMARMDEYLVLLKRLWANSVPFDHEGPFYSVSGGYTPTKPFGASGVPFVLGGNSGTAIKVAARHADVFALPATTAAEMRQTISRVRAAALSFGRADKIRFSLDIWPILPGSDAEAREKDGGHMHGSKACLAGAPDRIALSLLEFCDSGISEFVVHGIETERDVAEFGQTVVRLVKRSVDRHVSPRSFGASGGRLIGNHSVPR